MSCNNSDLDVKQEHGSVSVCITTNAIPLTTESTAVLINYPTDPQKSLSLLGKEMIKDR